MPRRLRFPRPDLLLVCPGGVGLGPFVLTLSCARLPRLPDTGVPIPPPPPIPDRGASGRAFPFIPGWSAVAAAESAAASEDCFSSTPLASWSNCRCENRCDLLVLSWTFLNLSSSSTQRILAAAERSCVEAGAVWVDSRLCGWETGFVSSYFLREWRGCFPVTYARGPVWRRPMLLTLLRRFLSAAKAELWGNSMRTPYKHLYRYGYLSGSRSWRRRSATYN